MAAEPPSYSRDQIARYFDRVKLPVEQRQYDVSGLDAAEALEYLSLLQTHQLAEVPFENLTLHYSTHRQVCIHPDDLFRKIVEDHNGRGGYCMENNTLFGTLLRSLGFTTYSGGARVWDSGRWTGWGHMVNLVTIAKVKYHVDVGFGADGPIIPMPLDHSGTIQKHIHPGSARLQWRNTSGNTDPDQRLWVYEYRRNDDSEWTTMYAYTELEFQLQDYAVMNYFTSTSPRTFFTRTVVAERKTMDEMGELSGRISLNGNSLKWRVHGELVREVTLNSEDERLQALEQHYGIRLGSAERDGIRGLASEIK